MKHKTAELEGELLDKAVTKANALATGLPESWAEYSRSCEYGGPLIERERISVSHVRAGAAEPGFWSAHILTDAMEPDPSEGGMMPVFASAYGETALIAAMRAFVVAKLGEEVEIP